MDAEEAVEMAEQQLKVAARVAPSTGEQGAVLRSIACSLLGLLRVSIDSAERVKAMTEQTLSLQADAACKLAELKGGPKPVDEREPTVPVAGGRLKWTESDPAPTDERDLHVSTAAPDGSGGTRVCAYCREPWPCLMVRPDYG